MVVQPPDGRPLQRHRLAVDVSAAAPAGVQHLAADVIVAADLAEGGGDAEGEPTIVLVCVPGGGMSRRYFDLQAEGAGDAYSMAAHLAQRDVIVVLLDHPGVGESDVPHDGYSLTPATVAAIDAAAVDTIVRRLGDGTLIPGVVAFPKLVPVGCGHSMGGLLTVWMQAAHRSYRAVATLGFAGSGLPTHLTDDERTYIYDPDAVARDIAVLVERRFGAPRSGGGRSSTGTSAFLLAVEVPEHAKAAIGASGAALLNLCGLTSMIPGASSRALEAIDVPVFLGVGEHDITGDAHRIPAQFPNSRDITLFVCPRSGHNHNVAPTRVELWDRLHAWLRQVAVSATPLSTSDTEAQ